MAMLNQNRIHAFDLIRALAALWGVIFHAGLPFLTLPDTSPWKIVDPASGSELIDFITWLSHRLRMPLFFIMSGFFTSLIIEKRGSFSFFKSRVKKVLIPLIVSGVIILPLIVELFEAPISPVGVLNGELGNPYRISNWVFVQIYHLWFLYYLFLYSLIAIAFKKVQLFAKVSNFFATKFSFALILLFLAFFTMHFFMDSLLVVNTTLGLSIDPLAFVYYYVLFGLGFILRDTQVLDKVLSLKGKKLAVIAFVAAHVTAGFLMAYFKLNLDALNAVLKFAIVLGTTLYGFTALFAILNLGLRYIKNDSSVINYLSDSSYFIYIAHLPIVILFQRVVFYWSLPTLIKWLAIMILSYLTLFALYHFFIRYSFIGTYLNGKRVRT